MTKLKGVECFYVIDIYSDEAEIMKEDIEEKMRAIRGHEGERVILKRKIGDYEISFDLPCPPPSRKTVLYEDEWEKRAKEIMTVYDDIALFSSLEGMEVVLYVDRENRNTYYLAWEQDDYDFWCVVKLVVS